MPSTVALLVCSLWPADSRLLVQEVNLDVLNSRTALKARPFKNEHERNVPPCLYQEDHTALAPCAWRTSAVLTTRTYGGHT